MAIDWTAISPLVIPQLNELFNKAQGAVPTSMNSVNSMVQSGVNSPLMDSVIQPAMQRLVAPQAAQRNQLTDSFRASGGLRSGQYGVRQNELSNQQGLQQNDLMAQIIQQMLSPLLNAQLQEQKNSFLPANAYSDILSAAKPTVIGGGNSSPSAGAVGSGYQPFSGFLGDTPALSGGGTGAMNPSFGGGAPAPQPAANNQPSTSSQRVADPWDWLKKLAANPQPGQPAPQGGVDGSGGGGIYLDPYSGRYVNQPSNQPAFNPFSHTTSDGSAVNNPGGTYNPNSSYNNYNYGSNVLDPNMDASLGIPDYMGLLGYGQGYDQYGNPAY